jgi:tRNA (adenine22-N1)-methyltransferase
VIYEILVAEAGDPLSPYRGKARSVEELIRIGPYLWEEKSPVLLRKWERERDKWKQIADRIKQSNRQETVERMEQINRELEWMEEVIQCLRTDKR